MDAPVEACSICRPPSSLEWWTRIRIFQLSRRAGEASLVPAARAGGSKHEVTDRQSVRSCELNPHFGRCVGVDRRENRGDAAGRSRPEPPLAVFWLRSPDASAPLSAVNHA